jgi:predicted Zn-dependent protease
MLLSPEAAKMLTDRILQRSRADHCVVTIEGGDRSNVRFAVNNATTNASVSSLSVNVTSAFGQRSGSVTVSSLDWDVFAAAQARSEEIARLAPPNPEYLPPLGPQVYERRDNAYDEPTARANTSDLAAKAKTIIDQARSRDVSAAGYAECGASFTAMATSAGLFAYDLDTQAQLTITGRNKAQTWSGWSGGSELRLASLDASRLGARAIGKADHSAEPLDLEPGKYTVILEPAAVADFAVFMLGSLDARFADEGRSVLAKKGGGTKLGERLLDERVTITSDPRDPVAPERTFGEDGLPQRRTAWIENGTVKNLFYSRFWAQKMGREPLPYASTAVMTGGTTPVEQMIADTKRGVLVTRLWYIREVDPQTLLLTGLTRDGNFLIENGKIAGPVRNFRFNESPVAVFNNILAIGPAERAFGGETETPIVVPPLLVKDFTFSSKANGI